MSFLHACAVVIGRRSHFAGRRGRLALVQLARLAGLWPMRRAAEYAAQLSVWFAGSAVPAQRRSP